MASIHPVNQRGKIHSTKRIRVQKLLACVLRNYPFIMIVIFVTSPALVLPEPAPCKLSHISKMASTRPVEEKIYNEKRERKREGERRGMGSAVIALLRCVFSWIS